MKLRLLCVMVFSAVFFMANGQTVGIVGSSTPNGWDGPDIEMVQDPDSAHIFSATATLIEGEAKFRLNNEWVIDWGSADFPSGVGIQGGDNIPVYAGEYDITLDTITGAYSFSVISEIGIIGDAIAGTEWTDDVNMYEDTNGVFFIDITLLDKNVKFRKDDDWIVSWGADSFPMGIGSLGGDNIPVAQAGDYRVTFDTTSGAYNFVEIITFTSIGIIGDATVEGWDGDDIDLTQNPGDPNLWEGAIDLGEGFIKFRANDEWAVDWGGEAFPTDTAVLNGNDIAVIPGRYLVSFNTETLVYSFIDLIYYEKVGIIGNAVDGWGDDQDRFMERSESDSAQWSLRTILDDGEAKFRADQNWDLSWGAGDFPSGVANTGANINITAGEYIINFNTTTKAYEFIELVIYDTVGIVGTATGVEDGWNNDVYLEKDVVDEQLWTISPITLLDGEAKFRANSGWTVNWGAADFPAGDGIQDGDNIAVVAGTYMVSFRSDDGSYGFQPPSSVYNESILKDIKVYPNPTDGLITIEMNSELILGDVNIEVIDITGKKLISTIKRGSGNARLDVSSLMPGNYYIKMFNKDFLVAKPINVK